MLMILNIGISTFDFATILTERSTRSRQKKYLDKYRLKCLKECHDGQSCLLVYVKEEEESLILNMKTLSVCGWKLNQIKANHLWLEIFTDRQIQLFSGMQLLKTALKKY